MGRSRKSKAAKKTKKLQYIGEEEEYKKAPHSFVFNRGHVGKNVKQLVADMRHMMEPYTASSLKVRKKNVLKDFVSVAGLLNVSHFVIFSKTEISINVKICRLPRGPTLTFKVHNYCLDKDVISSLRKPNLEQKQFMHPPLLVMNNFSGEGMQMKLMSTMFQNMFPSINVNKVKLNDIRRCVLVNYNRETKTIDVRHYNIRVVPVGMSRSMKKLVLARVPDLSKYKDISEFVTKGGYSSESEAEQDGPDSQVVLPQQLKSRGNIKATKSAVRLTELGPRLTLQLVKIEEGVCEGDIMFHEFVHKTEEELQAQKAMRQKKKKLKEIRKRKQEENIQKKKEKIAENKERSLEGMKRVGQIPGENVENPGGKDDETDEDDDVTYYKQEVGQEPDKDLFPSGRGRKRPKKSNSGTPSKRRKYGNDSKDRSSFDKKNKFKDHANYKGQQKDSKKFFIDKKKQNFKGKGKKPPKFKPKRK